MAFDSKGTVNKVMLIGRLGQDPDLKYTGTGVAVLTLSIATNKSYKDSSGQKVENTEWNRVVLWRKLAEIIAQYAKCGGRVYVEGSLVTRSWDDQDGVKRYTTEVVAQQVQLLDGHKSSGTHSSDGDYDPGYQGQGTQQAPAQDSGPNPDDEGDDLPF